MTSADTAEVRDWSGTNIASYQPSIGSGPTLITTNINYSFFDFDGVSQLLNAGVLGFDTFTSLVVSCWVKPSSDVTEGTGQYSPWSAGSFAVANTFSLNFLNYGHLAPAVEGTYVITAGTVPTDTWTHVVFWFTGDTSHVTNNLQMFFNGVREAVTDFGGPALSSLNASLYDFTIGSHSPASYYYSGYVDDLRIYTNLSSATLPAELYAAGRAEDFPTSMRYRRRYKKTVNSATPAYSLNFNNNNGSYVKADGVRTNDMFNGDFTMSLWCKLGPWNSAWNVIAVAGDAVDAGYYAEIYRNVDGRMATSTAASWVGLTVFSTNSFSADTNWHHYASVVDSLGHIVGFYIDGELQGTNHDSTVNIVNISTFQLGAYPYGGGQVNILTGQVDEVSVWSRMLSAAEVTNLYNGGAGLYATNTNPIFTNQLRAAFHLDENTGTTLYDISGNGNDGTIYGTASFTNLHKVELLPASNTYYGYTGNPR